MSQEVTLYNKYRPTRFDELVGQEDSSALLKNSLVEGMPHTLLFSGPPGTGKTTSARIVARSLNCAAPVEGEPCGVCEFCSFGIDDMPGVWEIDAASNSGVAEIRNLRDTIISGNSITPNRIFIVDEVHCLTTQGQSAFLKAIEEPPPNTYVIMATTEPEVLLSTISSRSMRVPFNEVNDDDLEVLVKRILDGEDRALEEEEIKGIVAEGDGSPRDTVSALQRVLLGGVTMFSGKGLDLASAILSLDVLEVLTTIAEVVSDGGSVYTLTNETLSYLRDAMIAASAPKLVSKRRLEDIKEKVDVSNPDITDLAILAIPRIASISRIVRTASEPRGLLEAELIGFISDSTVSSNATRVSPPSPVSTGSLRALEAKLDKVLDALSTIPSSPWPGVDNLSVTTPEIVVEEVDEVVEVEKTKKKEKASNGKEEKAEKESKLPESDDIVESLIIALKDELPARFVSRLSLISVEESEESDNGIDIISEKGRWPSAFKSAVSKVVDNVVPEKYDVEFLYIDDEGYLTLD